MLGLMLMVGTVSCSTLTVYVLNQDEIIMLKKGESFTAPYDGTFYSTRAEMRVMNVKVKNINLK
jgi:hypothetical protein